MKRPVKRRRDAILNCAARTILNLKSQRDQLQQALCDVFEFYRETERTGQYTPEQVAKMNAARSLAGKVWES